MILLLINVNRWLKLFGYCLVNGAAALIVVYSGSRGSLLALPLLFVMPILFALPLKLMKSPLVWGGAHRTWSWGDWVDVLAGSKWTCNEYS